MTTIFEGYERKAGSMTSERTGELIDYDNHMVYYTVEGVEGVNGKKAGEAKIKTKNLTVHGVQTLDELIGKQVIFVVDPSAKTPTITDIYLVGGKE